MRVLMISLDKNLIGGKNAFGDAVERHKLYGGYVDRLDIVVLNRGKSKGIDIAKNIKSYPTNSNSRFLYFRDAYKIGKKIYKKRKFDLIVCQDPFLTGLAGYLLKRKTNAKLIVHSHGDFFGNKYWLKENWFNLPLLIVGNFVIRRADAIRAVSSVIAGRIIKKGIGKIKIYNIPTPVDLEKFSSFNKKKVLKIREKYNNQKIVFFVGRLAPVKNIALLIDAFAESLTGYKYSVLLIAGDGELKEDLQKKIIKSGWQNNVFLLGAISHDNLPDFYRACDFFVLPSTNESFGKVLLESAAAKRTSIASDTVGAREIIKDEKTGYIVPINDKKALAKKILLLLKDKTRSEKMGELAYERVFAKYGRIKNIEKIIKMWEGVSSK